MKSFITLYAGLILANTGIAQTAEDLTKTLMPVPLNYTVFKADENIVLDGKDNEKIWGKAVWSEEFSDIEGAGGTRFPYKTRCKFLWDNDFLYVFLRMEEDALWAIHKKDEVVFRENVLKIFLDPDNNGHNLIEIQTNTYNEIHFLTLSRPYRDRGILNAGWMPVGAKSAVGLVGTINDPSDKDTEWTIEMALPLKGLSGSARIPQDGAIWRLDIQRTDYDMAVKDGVYSKALNATGQPLPQQNTAWSPPGMTDIPFPERWGYIQFNQAAAGSTTASFTLPYTEQQRRYLWAAYYRQKEWLRKNGRYAETLKELGIPETIMVDGKSNALVQEATAKQFIISIKEGTGRAISLNQDGFVQ